MAKCGYFSVFALDKIDTPCYSGYVQDLKARGLSQSNSLLGPRAEVALRHVSSWTPDNARREPSWRVKAMCCRESNGTPETRTREPRGFRGNTIPQPSLRNNTEGGLSFTAASLFVAQGFTPCLWTARAKPLPYGCAHSIRLTSLRRTPGTPRHRHARLDGVPTHPSYGSRREQVISFPIPSRLPITSSEMCDESNRGIIRPPPARRWC